MTKRIQSSQGSIGKILLALGAVVFVAAVLVLSILAVRNGNDKNDGNEASNPPSNNQQITVEGMFVCLPHKDKDGPQTLECASGIKTDKDKYYGLQFDDGTDFPSGGERLRVTGTLKDANDDIYDSEGNIEVESYKEL